MKQTITVNLGGTVFHIDQDAYHLLDNYLENLRIYFSREEGTDEIINDFQCRIAEIFRESVRPGREAITLEQVEQVITRMGNVDQLSDQESAFGKNSSTQEQHTSGAEGKVKRRLFRNPDDRVLGGVCGGLAAYFDCDVTLIRIVLFLLVFFFGAAVGLYLVLWLIVPLARTATERLQMRGEHITVENIGKTLTGGFDRISDNVQEYMHSERPRTALKRIGDTFVEILGWVLKGLAVLVGLGLLFPLLTVLFVLAIALIVFLVAVLVGGIGWHSNYFPFYGLELVYPMASWTLPFVVIKLLLLIGIPAFGLFRTHSGRTSRSQKLPSWVRPTLWIVWILALLGTIFCVTVYGIPFWTDGITFWQTGGRGWI
jgi:phage shock protein PspC (stress-responsive transcriptional regulator)